jgi:hypothetical protein
MRLDLGCRPAGWWTVRLPRARRSGWGSAWAWLWCGIAAAGATADGSLAPARVLDRARGRLSRPLDGSRRRPSQQGGISGEGLSHNLISVACAATASDVSHCRSSPNTDSHPHANNLNFVLVFSSFFDISHALTLTNANLKKTE